MSAQDTQSTQNAHDEADTISDEITTALLEGTHIDRVLDLDVQAVGDDLFVGAKISIDPDVTMREISVILYQAKRRVREAAPSALAIYIEPDVYFDPDAKAPTTSSIVTLSYD